MSGCAVRTVNDGALSAHAPGAADAPLTEVAWSEERYAGGLLKRAGWLVCGKAHGLWRAWDGYGRLASEESFDHGLLHGECRFFHLTERLQWEQKHARPTKAASSGASPAGPIRSIRRYRNNLLDGDYKEYSSKGTLTLSTQYDKGLESGTHIEWYSDGTLKAVYQVRQGARHGSCIHWHKNGSVSIIADYGHGRPIDPVRFFNEDGTLLWQSDK
ncbi:hypothetical protein EDM80_10835 [bacterium]|nr:MAG: hypothetical protein EDM80_10835 [bacterium]RIK60055.1 MAG: hypothetical protein DCC64_15045 [Planctomycetota bacterium]